jgi:D-alanyl-D-alanine carboxypeptidase (penicillin-binding protein 5/6)
MKNIFIMLLVSIMITIFPMHVKAEENNTYKAAILIDYKSGKVLYEKNKDQVLPEASITKLMTYYVIKDYLKNRNISEDTIIKIDTNNFITQNDASGIGLKKGQKISISDLITSMLVVSANDSAMALENFYKSGGGSFVDAMNKKASELGLKNTNFVNPTGLTLSSKTHRLNTTSAYDIAILSKNIIRDYPEILKITNMSSIIINGKTYINTNGTLKYNSNIDGLKTGYTKEAGYCLAATENIKGNRFTTNISHNSIITDDMRLISVVFGCETEEHSRLQPALMILCPFEQFAKTLRMSQHPVSLAY